MKGPKLVFTATNKDKCDPGTENAEWQGCYYVYDNGSMTYGHRYKKRGYKRWGKWQGPYGRGKIEFDVETAAAKFIELGWKVEWVE